MPAKAGIQYTAASQFYREASGILDHAFAGDDSECG
jgi:hypothetical protein